MLNQTIRTVLAIADQVDNITAARDARANLLDLSRLGRLACQGASTKGTQKKRSRPRFENPLPVHSHSSCWMPTWLLAARRPRKSLERRNSRHCLFGKDFLHSNNNNNDDDNDNNNNNNDARRQAFQ